MNPSLHSRMLLLAGILVLQSCTGTGSGSDSGDPFNKIPVIQTGAPLDIDDRQSSEDGAFFFRSKYFQDMKINRESHFFVYNSRGVSLLHFNDKGEFIGHLSSQGEGPGEFQGIPAFDILHRDSLFLLDTRSRIVSLFVHANNSWEYAGGFNLEGRDGWRPEDIIQLDNRRLAIVYAPGFRRLIIENGKTELRNMLDLVSVTGEPLQDSLLSFPHTGRSVYRAKSGASAIISIPYGPQSILNTGPGSTFYHLKTDTFLISVFDDKGRPVENISHNTFTVDLDEEVRRRAVEENVNVSMGSEMENRAMKDRVFEDMPKVAPPLDDMHVDRETGNIIVHRSDFYKGPNWLLMDQDGKRLGVFSLDPSLEVFDFRKGTIIGALMLEDEEALPTIRIVSLPPSVLE